ncbi:MAG: 3-dehydroquinate synthase [Candidatus Omnitrophica bacterium]|nr:3-dehydroquinate synthase [Candidatus Omnitrophota bacterium]
MASIPVRLGERSYIIAIEKTLGKLPRELRRLDPGTDAAVITNAKVKSLFGKKVGGSLKGSGLRVKFLVVPDSEKAKSLKEAMRLLASLSRMDGKGKRLCAVALGGGVVGDLGGFAASAYKRGIPYIQVPTTLLAQVDSSIGGKVAVDLPEGKNLVGSFYQPKLVYSNISFLRDLSGRDFASGMAEVIKYAVIKDRALFVYLERNRRKIIRRDAGTLLEIVKRCAKIKAGIVSKDEKEKKSIRTILNYGHTIGHAVEAAHGYSGAYSHGEAVGLGMIAAARMSQRLGIFPAAGVSRIERLIGSFGLPVNLEKTDTAKIMGSLSRDKKFIRGVNRFVLPVKIGRVVVREAIPEPLIREEIKKLYR